MALRLRIAPDLRASLTMCAGGGASKEDFRMTTVKELELPVPTSPFVHELMSDLKSKNPAEPEFHQAVQEYARQRCDKREYKEDM